MSSGQLFFGENGFSSLGDGAGRVGEVGRSRGGVSWDCGFADAAMGLPVCLLTVAVAVVS